MIWYIVIAIVLTLNIISLCLTYRIIKKIAKTNDYIDKLFIKQQLALAILIKGEKSNESGKTTTTK